MRHGTCFHRRLSAHHAGAAPHSAVAELGVVRRLHPSPVNSTLTISILAASSFFSAGCTTPPATHTIHNPMPAVWASIEARRDTLKKTSATQAQWTKASDGVYPISTVDQLHAAIAATGVPADAAERQRQQNHLERLFRTSHSTIHFGFECNYHAIVFFDAHSQQLYAHP